jgi:hypothetical protein
VALVLGFTWLRHLLKIIKEVSVIPASKGKARSFHVSLMKGRDHFGQQFIFEDVAETSVFLDELMENKGELCCC